MEHVEELCRNITILHRSNPVLQGSIREIKKRYPREKVILRTEDEVTGLEGISGVTGVKKHEYGYEVGIVDEAAAANILRHTLEQTIVNKFEIMEPTLNEIFIKAVGGDLHE
jgi:ABC-2 type transport system ATP-binding protein